MKIVQSFWSLPSKANNKEDFYGRNNGGWMSEKNHAMSWALSCLKFKQFYPEVELYSDKDGIDWLVNKLGLPYSNVTSCLDKINQFNPSLWALSKIYTYSLQKDPFLHADSDVYIWKPFCQEFLNSSLIAQNVEFDQQGISPENIYLDTAMMLQNKLSVTPWFLQDLISSYSRTGRINGFNTGIVGGQDVAFFQTYAKSVFKFLEDTKTLKYESKDMNFIEQLLFYCIAKRDGIPVKVLFGEENAVSENAYSSLMQFNLVPICKDYIHVVGIGKRKTISSIQLSMRLKYEFPVFHSHIESIYPENAPRFFLPSYPGSENEDFKKIFYNTIFLLKKLRISYKGGSVRSFLTLLERVTSEGGEDANLLLLSDIFQFERFLYKVSKKNKINSQPKNHYGKLLDLLYSVTVDDFLNVKFTLNSADISIVAVNFDYPAKFTAHYLTQLLEKKLELPLAENANMMVLSSSDKVINTMVLNSWDMLLIYFEDNEKSGNDLIEYVRQEGLFNSLSDEELMAGVLSFVTTYSLYFNFLKLV